MSFVDLATLALHRRNEMEIRISTFSSKCDLAINDIRKLKMKARTFVERLNCEPEELKERFLACMNQLDEYIYLMTDFNLSISKLEENGSLDMAPVQDKSYVAYPILTPTNLMDVLSEPAPSTSSACQNMCPVERPRRTRVPKREHKRELLIEFSSASCSAESVPEARGKVEKEVQCAVEQMEDLGVTDPTDAKTVNLPAQTMLEVDQIYNATIMSVDGPSIWVIVGLQDLEKLVSLVHEMTAYYSEHQVTMSPEEIANLSCCVFYDSETLGYYRALFIKTSGDDNSVEVFLVDTGEERSGPAQSLRPLEPRFCALPPLARCCHLADVDLLCFQDDQDKELYKKQEEFIKDYMGKPMQMRVDDNTSESLGVYMMVEDKTTLNARLVQEGLALAIDMPPEARDSQSNASPESGGSAGAVTARRHLDSATDSRGELTEEPEYTDAVQAVTGYSNRDEMDICRHYTGGPEKTCFKGARCRKRHVLMHPDGWTLDRVSVPACRTLPLPRPGAWLRVLVTYVCHFDRVCVQFLNDAVKEELPKFGVVLPPTTLEALVRDMNSAAARMAYKKLDLAPAPGELVAALYPPDDHWYRARVVCSTRADQSVEVVYIDYGNEVWVKEDAVRALEPRFLALPAQAQRCRLAGVAARGGSSRQWAAARAALTARALDRTLDARVISCDYDEPVIELFDAQGYSIAEQLEAAGLVTLEPADADEPPALRVQPA